ncbi:enoyl-CoA hydratase/isomerase family protein [Dictyocaulus viviparus]|uniref:3-hydroxyisobutyryl-CoA hydrolase n=1 Tax=Dictyocaulus viviparus TaxID=29172 RepID=A0A0D8Y896_DICVI|nr:enoyl-CoA hydratase/isomerase family protein [Dictyocaulus viviparus]
MWFQELFSKVIVNVSQSYPETPLSKHICLQLSSQLAEILKKWPGGQINITAAGDVARLKLNRPEKSNCLSGEMMLQLGEKVKELANLSSCAVLVIEGTGPSFCSGADLGLIDQVSVARLHGHCLGGATEIASSCDLRVAHKDAKVCQFNSSIGFLQSRMGIVPSWGGAAYLDSIIGRSAALRVMTTAPILTAVDAKSIGYVDVLYDTEDDFEKFVSSMTKNGADVCKAQKAMLNAYKHGGDPNAVIRSVWGSDAQKAAIIKQMSAVMDKKG